MIIEHGNIWDFQGKGWITVPTNIGWKSDGSNVMGAGVAQQAANMFPKLPYIWGFFCRMHSERNEEAGLLWVTNYNILCFPVKPINKLQPFLSWKNAASLKLIEEGLDMLSRLPENFDHGRPVYLPLLGCGNGGLQKEEVMPLLEKYLTSDRFHLVLYND